MDPNQSKIKMRVFLTGATGHVGGAVAEEFIRAGHTVTALVRSAEGAARVAALGAHPLRGVLGEPESYQDAAAESEVLVHTAFEYTPEGTEVRSTDQTAARALLAAARGAGRRFIYTSSVYLLGGLSADPVDETVDTAAAPASSQWRLALEREVLGDARSAVVRCGLAYGGRGGTMPLLFGGAAAEDGVAYPGDGRNRWALVYLRDLAALYLAIAERGATGIFHGVDGAPLRVREVAEVASRAAGTGGRTRAVPYDDEDEHTTRALARDVAVVSRRSRELGWTPRFASFQDGAEQAFAEWSGR
jgi:nucleoside-diphosphate-sugar epimerase